MSMISEQRHIRAIRDGVISAIPFIIAGSLILIIAAPPVPETSGFAMWAKDHAEQILNSISYDVRHHVPICMLRSRFKSCS